jgi:hypothetical protein
MSFIHVSEHYTAPHRHDTADEARECEYAAAWEDAHADVPTCSICDGIGHGYPGAGPCPLECDPIAWMETEADEERAAAMTRMLLSA